MAGSKLPSMSFMFLFGLQLYFSLSLAFFGLQLYLSTILFFFGLAVVWFWGGVCGLKLPLILGCLFTSSFRARGQRQRAGISACLGWIRSCCIAWDVRLR